MELPGKQERSLKMMKKKFLWIALVAVLALTLGITTFSYAQSRGEDMRGFLSGVDLPHSEHMDPAAYDKSFDFHSYLIAALAAETGIPEEELTSRQAGGETLWDILSSTGLTEGEFYTLMESVFRSAVEAALADGVITEEQAAWMLEHFRLGLKMGPGKEGTGPWHAPGGPNNFSNQQGPGPFYGDAEGEYGPFGTGPEQGNLPGPDPGSTSGSHPESPSSWCNHRRTSPLDVPERGTVPMDVLV
jgi:hypothetical protein